MKVVVNRSVGASFCLSRKALERFVEYKGAAIGDRGLSAATGEDPKGLSEDELGKWSRRIAREDSDLVRVVEELGLEAAGRNCELLILEIPEIDSWWISEIVGYEFVVIDGRVH